MVPGVGLGLCMWETGSSWVGHGASRGHPSRDPPACRPENGWQVTAPTSLTVLLPTGLGRAASAQRVFAEEGNLDSWLEMGTGVRGTLGNSVRVREEEQLCPQSYPHSLG